jgi:Flp pilus assembly protein protease CpaA
MIGVEKYYFLFGLALIWCVFAAVYDIRKREVPNWLSFSLIAFALAYRAFYAAGFDDWMFFLWGLAGFGVFVVLGNLFYYSKMFAGGDAKLLMGLGAVLPLESWMDFVYVGGGFVLLMFVVGAVYSIVYSAFIAVAHRKMFGKEFSKNIRNRKYWGVVFFALLLFVAVFSAFSIPFGWWIIPILFSFLLFLMVVYLKSVEVCMIKLVNPGNLTEGDWIVGDIRLKGYVVRKTVHGLSIEDIKHLRKAGKKIYVKEGVPFVPAILIAFLVMVFFLAVLGLDFQMISFLS